MTHLDVWNTFENFAKHHGISCSAMARKCGMNATAFNKSKRFSKHGQPRWPSVQTVAKILDTYKTNIYEFLKHSPKQYVSDNKNAKA